MNIYSFLNYLNLFSLSLIVIFTGIVFQKLSSPTKIYAVTFFIVYLIQVTTFILARLSINNLLLFHIYFAVQLTGYGLFYWKILPGITAKKWFLAFLLTCLALIGYEYSAKWNNLARVFGGYSYFAMNLIFVFTSIFYLVGAVLRDQKIKQKYLNYGMVVYAGGSSVIFLLGDKINQIDWKPLLIFNVLLYLVFQGFYFAEIWKAKNL